MFGSHFTASDEDPFFRDFHENHRRMMGGFYGGPFSQPSPFMAIAGDTEPRSHSTQFQEHGGRHHRQPRHNDMFSMAPFAGFGMMDSMFRNMERNFERMANDPNTHTYSHSSVMSFSNNGSGAPEFYEATSSTTKAPGGIKEERKTVKDSRTGTQKMSISHRIGDREHRIEKSKDARTGNIDENQEFVNMDETDAPAFDQEFQHRTSRYSRGHHRNRQETPAIAAGPRYREREEDDKPLRPEGQRRRTRPEMHDI